MSVYDYDMLPNRNRIHVEAHLRSLDQQILDALLRIEEILGRAFPDPRKEAQAIEALAEVSPRPSGITKVRRR
jgi:hypothetical protein